MGLLSAPQITTDFNWGEAKKGDNLLMMCCQLQLETRAHYKAAYLARQRHNCKVIPAIDGDMLQVQVQCRDNNNTRWRKFAVSLSRWFNYIVCGSGPEAIESVLTKCQPIYSL